MAKKKTNRAARATGSQAGGSGRGNRSSTSAEFSTPRTEDYFRQRAERGNVAQAKRILRKAGRGRQPEPGDEL